MANSYGATVFSGTGYCLVQLSSDILFILFIIQKHIPTGRSQLNLCSHLETRVFWCCDTINKKEANSSDI